MSYYFNRIRRSDLEKTYSNSVTITKYLKERCEKYLKLIRRKIYSELFMDVKPFWTDKRTFGSVLCDFEPQKRASAIIGPHMALFSLVAEEIDFLIISDKTPRNFKYKTLSTGEKILIINIMRFRRFIETFSDKYKRIRLFLVKELTSEEEEIINDWIDLKHSKKKEKYISADEMVENLPKNDPEKALQIFASVTNYYQNQIIFNIDYFEKQLNSFEEKINNPKTLEKELRDFLQRDIWILDFKYQNINQFNCEKEIQIDFSDGKKGFVDLWVSRFHTQRKKDIWIELKLAEDVKKKSVVKYRNREAIGSEVGKAISQLIHYIDSKKEKFSIQEGIVVIGREAEDSFINKFNEYLHGIKIKSYCQLIEDCRNVIEVFKSLNQFKQEELEKQLKTKPTDK